MADPGPSPDPLNYFVGKGKLYWYALGSSVKRDLGNGMVETTVAVTKLEHYSSRTGIKTKDLSVVQQVEMSYKLTLDEMTPENLQMALMANEDSTGSINIGSVTQVQGALRLVGTNSVGRRFQVDIPTVNSTPSGAQAWIADGFGVIELAGEVLADENGIFGQVHDITDSGEINP